MKIVAIIQARMGATRLPNKVLLELLPGRSALSCMLERVKKSRYIHTSIVATTTNPRDQAIVDFLQQQSEHYFVGSEQDVLDRYYQAAMQAGLGPDDVVVRLTADCPVIDPVVIDGVIEQYLEHPCDYAANGLEPYTYPDGMDTEVFSFAALEKVWKEAQQPSHREHVTFYFWKNPQLFRIVTVKNPIPNQEGYRLTLDYPEDFELLKKVYEGLYFQNPLFSMEDIIAFLDSHPDIKQLNQHVARNVSWKTA